MALITPFWTLDGLIVFFNLVILVYYFYVTRNFNYWKNKGVNEVSPVAFFGSFKDVLLLKTSAGEWFKHIYKIYASLPYVGLYIIDQPFLMIRDPEIIKNVMIKDFHSFTDRNIRATPNDSLGSANLFLLRYTQWKYLRAKLTPIYTSEKLKKMFHLMLEVCNDFNTFLESQDNETVLEMNEISASFMTDMIVTTAFGVKANSLIDPDAEFRKHGRKILNFSVYRGYESLVLAFLPQLAKLFDVYFFHKENVPFFRNAFWSIIKERKKSGIKRFDFIDLIIELQKSQTDEEKEIFDLAGDNFVAQAAAFFVGGFGTSSATMSFTLYEMALNQEIQETLRRDIGKVLDENDGELTFETVSSGLPYLDMIIAETLRIYSPLPFLDRIAANDYKIPGSSNLIIKKGTPLIIPVAGLHMDEKYFPEPHRYNPDNFSAENKKSRNSGVYIPFGAGPHTCIGERYGLLQVKLALIKIILNYEVLTCEKTPIPFKFNTRGLFTTSASGIYLKLRKIVK